MTFNFIIRSNDTEGTFERKNTQHRVIPRVYRASMTQSCEEKEGNGVSLASAFLSRFPTRLVIDSLAIPDAVF